MSADFRSWLDATVIRAPVTGTILERTAEKGELVTAQFASGAEGGPQGQVVALADLNDLQVELDIAQDDFAKLSPKQKGVLSVDAYPDRKYDGEIHEISPEANRQKATVQVKVQILNPDQYLRPEMNATVRFLADDSKKAVGTQSSGVLVPANGDPRPRREKDGASGFQRKGAGSAMFKSSRSAAAALWCRVWWAARASLPPPRRV